MNTLSIQLIRSATLKIKYAGKTFLVDPVLGPKHSFRSFVVPGETLNPTVDLPIPVNEIVQGIDVILATHTHPDHFDEMAAELLDKNLPVFTQPVDQEWITGKGFLHVEGISQSATVGEITITRTGGKHGPPEELQLLGEVSGFVLTAPNHPSVYIVGDCIWDKEIEHNLRTFLPDIVITNSGAAVFRGRARILMNEEETLNVAKAVPKASVIVVHLEALDHCKTTRESMKMAAEKANLPIIIPQNGETVLF